MIASPFAQPAAAGQPSTSSFVPRRFAGARPPSPQGDGSETANGLAPQQTSRRPSWQTATPPQPQTPTQTGQPTFAQLQEQGQARPNPLVSHGPAGIVDGPSTPTPTLPAPTTSAPTPAGTTTHPAAATGAQSAAGPLDADLLAAVRQALAQPSRYDDEQLMQVRDALTGKLEQQFGADQVSLDDEMARRGLSASTIGSQYQTDLKGRHADALAGLDASLIQDAAGTWANDRSSALSAGQNFANMGLQNSQFSQSLAQALGLAQMGDKTANRGIDAQSALANNDLMLRVLAALGLPSTGLTGGTGTGTTTGTTGTPSPTGAPPPPQTGTPGTTGSPTIPGGPPPQLVRPNAGAPTLTSQVTAAMGGNNASVNGWERAPQGYRPTPSPNYAQAQQNAPPDWTAQGPIDWVGSRPVFHDFLSSLQDVNGIYDPRWMPGQSRVPVYGGAN